MLRVQTVPELEGVGVGAARFRAGSLSGWTVGAEISFAF